MVKKQGVIFLFIFLGVLLFANISAESCSIVLETSCTDNIVMGVSSTTNAHGELASQGNYDYVLCCDFGTGDAECSGTNKILGLELTTNSHAEIPSLENYAYDICYENLTCASRATCNSDEMGVLSLSSETDAHIGGAGDYDAEICCIGMCDAGEEYVAGQCVVEKVGYWADATGYVSVKNVLPEYTRIFLILANSRLDEGTEVDFTIYENDVIFDDEITTLSGDVDADGNVNVTWLVTQEDLDKTSDYEEFYFEVSDETSNLLEIVIVNATGCSYIALCSDYQNEGECEEDICGAAEFSVESKDADVSCGVVGVNSDECETWIDCGCDWVNNSCGPKRTERIQADCMDQGNPSTIGSCFYSESTSDNCDDGFLTYSWDGSWSWDLTNIFGSNPDGDDYIQGTDLSWHYDPDIKNNACADGSKTVPCPAQIRLPFFGAFNLMIGFLLIGLIYYFMEVKKKG